MKRILMGLASATMALAIGCGGGEAEEAAGGDTGGGEMGAPETPGTPETPAVPDTPEAPADEPTSGTSGGELPD